ncbi:hypothetical protein [Pedobacter flavus]|uniref:DUF5658 domain-containing protein n=1 Tax=Pedobacter flavus TaxID=3113906 RepID=A0ABU7H1T3_9SPHI|nr:hypothetical protein [Pedobacter sp. VNH31]MEE1885267.1 hypothetical protein [Pedobacter sp. VNH31]
MLSRNWIFWVASFLLILILYDVVTWILIATKAGSHETSVIEYLQRFPDFLQNPRVITFLELIVLGCSIFLFYKSSKLNYKVCSKIGFFIASILFGWLTFSLM